MIEVIVAFLVGALAGYLVLRNNPKLDNLAQKAEDKLKKD